MTEPFKRKLYRSSEHRMIAGVCGGLADWLDIDPTVVRVLYVLASLLSAAVPGVLLYVVLWVIIPPQPVRVDVMPAAATSPPL